MKIKRKISIALILVIVLSMFNGFVYAEEKLPDSIKDIFDGIVGSEIMENFIKSTTEDKIKVARALLALEKKGVEIAENLMDVMREKAPSLKMRLKNNGVDRDVSRKTVKIINSIRDNFSIFDFISEGGLSKKIELDTILKDGSPSITVGTELSRIYAQLIADQEIKAMNDKINEKLKDTGGAPKAKILLEIIESFIKNTEITRDSYNVSIETDKIVCDVKTTINDYFGNGVELTEKESEEIEQVLTELGNKMESRLAGDTFSDEQKTAIVEMLIVLKGKPPIIPPDDDEPSIPPSDDTGGGGGGTGKSETPPEEEKPETGDEKIEVELGKDAVEVKTGDKGQSVVAVKSESVKAAVEELVKAVKETPTAKPVVTIKLDDVKTAAMEVSVPKDAMTQLIENNVELVIESKSLSYEIPAEALQTALRDVAEDAQVEFSSEIVSVEEAEQLFTDEYAVKTAKVIQFSISIKDKDGKEIDKIEKFGSKIRISIEIEREDGNPDLLAVFYINEETGTLEFVGGKIKDNKIIITTDHYSKFAVIEYDKSFDDIENHWSKDYVKSMVAKHVIDGFEDGTYRPEDKLTRAQFAKLLVEALELDMAVDKGNFEDVGAGHWAKDYIETARQQGIVSGYGDGTFKPEQFINRSEMATTITNALKLDKNISSTVLGQFRDSPEIPSWAVEYVVPVVAEGLLVGSDGILNPLGNVTRAEAATITYRVYNR
ncbi:MAG TPA: S-layer homology domain-containing protein [Clostridia bacterium]|nr:S-layer homology domain-containing protein [Clostridia bacterium]